MNNKLDSFKKFLISPAGNLLITVSLYVPILGLLLAFLTVFDAPIIAVIMAICFSYFGWQALSRITPDIFLIMPIGGWIAYFIIKACLSFFLGTFLAPLVIGKKVTSYISKAIGESMTAESAASKSKPTEKKAVTVSNANNTVKLSEFQKMMASLPKMNESELEAIHQDLLFYLREFPVPIEGRDYLADLARFQRKPVNGGPVYGCATYGEIEKLNGAIVDILNELDKKANF